MDIILVSSQDDSDSEREGECVCVMVGAWVRAVLVAVRVAVYASMCATWDRYMYICHICGMYTCIHVHSVLQCVAVRGTYSCIYSCTYVHCGRIYVHICAIRCMYVHGVLQCVAERAIYSCIYSFMYPCIFVHNLCTPDSYM